MSEKPILIIGPPRSGTTLLTTMLNSHPDIFIANEAKVFVRLLPQFVKSGDCPDEAAVNGILSGLQQNELYYLAPLPDAKSVLQGRRLDAVTVLRSLFEQLAAREGKRRWGEKTAVAYRQLALIRNAFPDAVYLGLDRDPYEVANSYLKENPKWGALGALVHWLDFRRVVFAQVPDFDFMLVDYTALVSEPVTILQIICDFLGEEYDSAMLDYYNTDRARALAGDTTFHGSAKPLYQSSKPPADLQQGLTGLIIRRLIKADPLRHPVQHRRSILLNIVRAWVYIRAVAWTFWHRLRRT